MADSLDDFFAKKDKKRGKDKTKTSALSNEALVRELEEGSKQTTDYPVRKDKTSVAMELLGIDANDDNWKDFEEVEKRDYTGLKVKEMSLQDQNEEEQRQRASVEQTEQVPESTPWKIKDEQVASTTAKGSQQTSASSSDDQKTTKSDNITTVTGSSEDKNTSDQNKDAGEKSSTDVTAKKDVGASVEAQGKYRPPAQRMMPESSGGGLGGQFLEPIKLSQTRASGSRSKEMNLENKIEFPSLG